VTLETHERIDECSWNGIRFILGVTQLLPSMLWILPIWYHGGGGGCCTLAAFVVGPSPVSCWIFGTAVCCSVVKSNMATKTVTDRGLLMQLDMERGNKCAVSGSLNELYASCANHLSFGFRRM
jgi:hypothetical protein